MQKHNSMFCLIPPSLTLLQSLSQESDSVVNSLSNMTKPTLPESLCQEPEFIENTLYHMTKPALLE